MVPRRMADAIQAVCPQPFGGRQLFDMLKKTGTPGLWPLATLCLSAL